MNFIRNIAVYEQNQQFATNNSNNADLLCIGDLSKKGPRNWKEYWHDKINTK